MLRFAFPLLLLSFLETIVAGELTYAPAPVDNPLKGLVPYLSAPNTERFPHSLKFQYFSLKQLNSAKDTYDWSKLESALTKSQDAGCQMILRIYLEYPGKESGMPDFLIDEGVKLTEWEADGSKNLTPDYEDPRLREALTKFITAFGEKYDGDPRIGFITVGLLGMWGEWHNYPRTDLWASKETQVLVLNAFEKSFSRTRLLLRYPAGPNNPHMAKTIDRPFGYHDDSFSWATLKTGKPEDDWYFLNSLEKAGGLNTWKKHPIGGETRPELWPTFFTDTKHERDQGFDRCVQETHASWLLDSGVFDARFDLPPKRLERATKSVQKMGYEFYVSSWEYRGGGVELSVENRGNAPFYYNWPLILEVYDAEEKLISTAQSVSNISTLLPGESAIWSFYKVEGLNEASYRVRIPNPMPGGKSLRFANETEGNMGLILGTLADGMKKD